MIQTATALSAFWNQFKIPAYVEGSVPEKAKLPYITYTLQQYDWRDSGMEQARVWYRSESFALLTAKVAEIQNTIGLATSLSTDSGCIVIMPGTPYVQNQPTDDKTLKVIYMNFDVLYLTN